MPASLSLQVIAAYTLPSGQPRTASLTVPLPLSTVGQLMPAVKLNTFKFTVEVKGE